MTATLLPLDRPAPRSEALRCRVVRRHLTLQALGQIADAAVALTLARLLLIEVADTSARDVAVGIAASVVPAVLSLPLAWLVADSVRRNSSLAVAHVVRSLITLAAALVPLTANHAIGFAVIAATTAAQTFTGSLRSASLGHAVPTRRLVAANSLVAATGKAAGAIGISVVFTLHALGPITLFALAAAMHLVTAAGYATWSTDLGGRHGRSLDLAVVARAVMQVLRHPAALSFVPTAIALRAVQGGATIALIAVLEHQSAPLASSTALALGATSTGVFVGMMAAPNYWRRHDDWRVRWSARVTLAAASGAAVLLDNIVLSIVAVCVISITFGTLKVQADTAVQSLCSGPSRGRVCSAYDASYHVAFVVGAGIAATNPLAGHDLGHATALATAMALIAAYRLTVGRRRGPTEC